MIPTTFLGKGQICSSLLTSALFPGTLEFKLLSISFCGFSLWKDLYSAFPERKK